MEKDKHMKHGVIVIAILLAACGGESGTEGVGSTTQRSFQQPKPSDVAASDAEALTVLDFGPVERVKTKNPIELSIYETEDGSVESTIDFLASASGYTVGIGLGDPLNRTEWLIGGGEGLNVIASVSIEDLDDYQIVRMTSGTATATVEADRATITITNAGAIEMEHAVSGSVSGKLVRSCYNRVPAEPDAEGNPSTEETMPKLDPEWNSEFCQRYE